jgi:LuxR family maltose regulon positive regulatory protein
VRVFLDEGEPMAKLLHLAKARRIEVAYVTELLSNMAEAPGSMQAAPEPLVEPLSTREVEVLKLIEAGYSNHEIATRLVISIATVKRHISNIYTKLSVQNRTQAVAMGKELGLFD